MEPAVFHFNAPFNISAKVDADAGIIRGAAVITGGVTARGHNLETDDKTLEQIIECGQTKGRVQVKVNHKSGVEAICGYLTSFRLEGNKVLADWHLLKTHEEYSKIIEKAERMPDCFGLSAAFAGPKKGEKKGTKNYARCTELLAVDCVAMPAANPDGLFEALDEPAVDTPSGGNRSTKMPDKTPPAEEPTLAQVLEALNGMKKDLTERLDGIETRQQEIEASISQDTPLSREELEELNTLTDAQLAEQGITRAEITAAIAAVDAPAAPHESPADTRPGAPAATTAPAVSAETATALSSLRAEITQLKAKFSDQEEATEIDQIMVAFDALEEKHLATLERCQALENQLRLSGGVMASPGAQSVRMFDAKDGDENVTDFEALVTKHKQAKEGRTEAEAIRLAMKENPQAYSEHQAARGIVRLG